MIFDPIARSVQIVHQSCIKINTISKRTKTSFHLTTSCRSTIKVRPNQFLYLWYVRRKPCTYLAWRIALSPNGPKWASTWPASPRSSIGCAQNDFWAYGTFIPNHTPFLHRDLHYLQTDQNEFILDPIVLASVTKMISEPMVCSSQTMLQSCVNINTILERTEMSFNLTNVT
jgi:hypothetical protein